MNRRSHLTLGGVFGAVTAYQLQVDVQSAALIVSTATWAGTWPDIDNQRWFRKLDRWTPDEALGAGGPLAHRGATHWWGWPLVMAVTALLAPLSPFYGLVLWGGAAGCAAHVVGDFLVGKPGVPAMPWWGHVGLRLKYEGFLESMIIAAAVAALIFLVPGGPQLVAQYWSVTADSIRP